MQRWHWKRIDYLVHRWVGVTLGLLMLSWFLSGIALMYYPWPAPTESRRLALLTPLRMDSSVIGFAAAARVAEDAASSSTGASSNAGGSRHGALVSGPLVGGRLMRWGGRVVYQLWRDRRGHEQPAAVVDAVTGALITPLDSATAIRVATDVVGTGQLVRGAKLLAHGDHYMMAGEYAASFPAYRVRFDDARGTAVYVGQAGGEIVGIVTNLTRLTTWTGTVPHWLYFQWLYSRPELWTWANLVLPSVAIVIALTGIVLGTHQLFPRRRRGEWRVSAYRGVSKWHHVAGVVFGTAVLTWTLSGVFEILGVSNEPRPGQWQRVSAGPTQWSAIHVGEADAVRLAATGEAAAAPVAVDLVALEGRVGYEVHFQDRREVWVDATTGAVRGEIASRDAVRLADRVMGADTPIQNVARITAYDTYYYSRHGRESHLPAWRVAFGDRAESVVYLDPVTGVPVGFVDADTRAWRWLRDAMHCLDLPAINNRRPLWDAIVLPLMIGGTLSAITGVWLLLRRVRRVIQAPP